MYKEVERLARERFGSSSDVGLDVYAQNTSSIAFHTKIGFRQHATLFRRASRQVSPSGGGGVLIESEEGRVRLVVDEVSGQVVGRFACVVSKEHAFGVSYGEYEYPYVFLEFAESKRRGVGQIILRELDVEAARANVGYVLTSISLSNVEGVRWLEKNGFVSYVCIFSRVIE